MKPLFYIMKRSFVNHLKKLLKKPLYLILYIFLLLAIVGFIVISFIMPSENIVTNTPLSFGIISSMFVLMIAYFQLNQGIEKGSSFFRQSDVNMVFTAPISPKKVLVYGFIKQMFTTLFMIFFIIFQIPNLKNFYDITDTGIIIIFVSVFMLFFSMSLISLIIYSVTSKKKSHRALAKKIVNGIYLSLITWVTITLIQVKDMIVTANTVFESKVFSMIPLIGWFKEVLSYATKPIDTNFVYNAVFIIITVLLLIILLYNVNTDYYEDVLGATERKEQLVEAKKTGSKINEINADKVKKVKQGFGSGGAKAIYYKHLIEYRKNGFFLIGKETIVIIAVGIMSKYFMNTTSIRAVLYFSIYLLFIFSLQGKWMEEMKMHYIYVIPADSIEKVFYGTLANHLKNFVDGLLLFSIAGFLFKANILVILLSAITYTTYGALFVYTDVLARRIFGSTHSKVFRLIMKFILVFLIIIPGITAATLVEFLVLKGAPYAPYANYAILIGYNIVVSFLLLLSGKRIFEVSEI